METEGDTLFVYVGQKLRETSIWNVITMIHNSETRFHINKRCSTGQPGILRNSYKKKGKPSKNYRHPTIDTRTKQIQRGRRWINRELWKDKTDETLSVEGANRIVENRIGEKRNKNGDKGHCVQEWETRSGMWSVALRGIF